MIIIQDGNQCKFFCWLDEEEVVGWPKKALITAWDKIRQKNKLIAKLTEELSETKSAAHVKKLDVSTTNMEGESSESASSVHDQDDGSMARLLWNMHRLSVLEDHKSKFPVGVSRIFKNVTSCEIFEEFGCDELLIVRIDVCCCVFFMSRVHKICYVFSGQNIIYPLWDFCIIHQRIDKIDLT